MIEQFIVSKYSKFRPDNKFSLSDDAAAGGVGV